MTGGIAINEERERVIVVGTAEKGEQGRKIAEQEVEELASLVEQVNAVVIDRFIQARESPESGLGRGAIDEVSARCREFDAQVVISNADLSPSHLLQWEALLPDTVRIIDRTQVILDIFARHATSREGRLQVELAQLQYLLPRLRGNRQNLSRAGGGIGTRGPGETRLEMDRRKIRRRIADLTQAIDRVRQERELRRRRRQHHLVPVIALVGYTNVGKSTLFQRLT
ncbi:MAG: GTPase HflX, partial [Firmicutes bacterium]|nr:GTPase HflX [Bacillota bacterium]